MNNLKFIFLIFLRYLIHLPNKLFYPVKVKKDSLNSEFKKKGFLHIKKNDEIENIILLIENNLNNLDLLKIINDHKLKNINKYSINIYEYLNLDVKKKIENFFSEKNYINFINNLTMTKLKLRKVILLLNFYNPNTIEDEGPKMFHRDSDSLQDQLKVFILVNNIDYKTGMFYFISKEIIDQYSAINPTIKRKEMDVNNKWRIEKNQMNYATNKNINSLFGLRGETLYIDTTNVYHRGGYVYEENKYRILLNPVFTPLLSLSDWNSNKNVFLKFLQRKLTALKYRLLKKYNY